MYVGLDSDRRYMKGQQKLLKDATTTSLSIEDNFKKLGIKTSAEYRPMRAKIGQRLPVDRPRPPRHGQRHRPGRGAERQTSSDINDQQFGKQRSIIDSKLKSHWIGVSVAIAGGVPDDHRGPTTP